MADNVVLKTYAKWNLWKTRWVNNDELDNAIDKYLKYIAVFCLLFEIGECWWLYKLAHKYGKKTANINSKNLLQAVFHWAVIGYHYTKTAKIKWQAIDTLNQQISNGEWVMDKERIVVEWANPITQLSAIPYSRQELQLKTGFCFLHALVHCAPENVRTNFNTL